MKNSKRDLSPAMGGSDLVEITLEKIIGNTVKHAATVICGPGGEMIYPAGCVVVLYDPKLNQQRFLWSDNNKAITCVAISSNGRYLAAGEMGNKPAIIVWELGAECSGRPVAQLRGHQFGIAAVAFAPDSKHIVSAGFQQDGFLHLWEWRSGKSIASTKVATKIFGITFCEDANNFVTCGTKHLKFWQLRVTGQGAKARNVLEGKAVTLGAQKNATAMDVAYYKNSIYCAFANGCILSVNSSTRVMEKTINVKAAANSVAVSERYVACACADGKVRLFETSSLRHLCMLPYIAPFGYDGLSISTTSKRVHADAICCRLSLDSSMLTVVYSDRTICCWDISDVKRIVKRSSLLGHCGAVWDVQTVQEREGVAQGVITCSADNTIRFWKSPSACAEDDKQCQTLPSVPSDTSVGIDPGLLNMVHVGDDLSGLKQNITDYERKIIIGGDSSRTHGGIRCVRASPNGCQLAAGDSTGNLRVFQLPELSLLHYSEAHEAEILSLAYTQTSQSNSSTPYLLASAGRDRLIHLFDCNKEHRLVHTMEEHSSAVTAITFATPRTEAGHTTFISCGADKSTIFRSLRWASLPSAQSPADSQGTKDGCGIKMERYHTATSRGTVYDVIVHPSATTAVATHDKRLHLHDVVSGRRQQSSVGMGEDMMKIAFHPQGGLLAASASDRKLWIYAYPSLRPLAVASAHSDLITAIAFTENHLISASADGCIFVWRIPHKDFESKLAEHSEPPLSTATVEEAEDIKESADESEPLARCSMETKGTETTGEDNSIPPPEQSIAAFIDMSALPAWGLPNGPGSPSSNVQGKWAQRVEEEGLIIQSDLEDDRFVDPFASDSRRFTIEPQGDPTRAGAPPVWGEGVAPTGRLSISSRFFAFSGRPSVVTERPQPHQLRREIPSRTRPTTAPPAATAAVRQNPPAPLAAEALPLPHQQPASPESIRRVEGGPPPGSPPSPAGESGTEEEDIAYVSDGGLKAADGECEPDMETEESIDSQWDAETCRRAMEGLQQLLEINLQLYSTTKRRLAMGERVEGEEGLLEEFGRVFSNVHSRVETACPPAHMMAPLEKYSQLLLQLVQSKLEGQTTEAS